MAKLAHAEPIHLYSLWGNHISPKNSKWIQENLKDMDMKVKEIMKLIEGDADTFARRADMYYKKRPELKKLVEEFYRGYRALVERYEHSTRVLRHAHRTMEEAFPNQIPFSLSDESPYALSGNEMESHSSEILLADRSQFDSDDLRKGSFGSFSDFHARKRYSLDSEDSDPLSSRKGVKQYNEMLAAGEGGVRANTSGGKVRKVLSFLEEDAKIMENKAPNQDYEAKVKQEANSVISNLHQDISKLSSEIHVLKDQIMEESKRANNAENEIQSLRGTLSKLNSERDETLLQHQGSLERISNLELLLSNTESELKKLSDDMTKELKKLKNVEELNQSLQLDLDTLEKKARMQENELNQKQEELENLQTTLEDKYQKCLEAEIALESSEKKYIQSQEEVKSLGVEIQEGTEKLRNVELHNKGIEGEICRLKEENNDLNEQMVHSTLMIKGLQDEIILLSESKTKLEGEIRILLEEKEVLSQELNRVKEEKNDLECRHQDLVEKMQAIGLCVESLQAAVKELENGNYELKEVCMKHEAEKDLLVEKLEDMDKISQKNSMLEKFILDANIELEALREKVVALESTHESLKGEISIYISERDSLASQVRILSESVEMLSANNTFLENSLSDARIEVESLRSKLKDSEESCQFLGDQNSILVSEKDTLLSQVENVTMNLEDLERRYAEVMEKHLELSRERDQLIDQVKELEDTLKFEKQEQEILMASFKNLLGTSENQISILREENQQKEKELHSEQHNLMCASIENFILQRSLYDLKEGNMFLFLEGQKHLESCKSAERLILELDQERLVQQRNISSLSKRNERIRKGICELLEAFAFEQVFESPEEIQDEVLLDIILSKIRRLLASISEVEGDNQRMHLELSVIGTILRHMGIDVVHLGSQKYSLERELEIKNGKLFALANEKHELLQRNELLMRDLEASNQREELLNTGLNALSTQLTDLQEVIQTRQFEIANVTEEKKNLSQHFCTLKQQNDILQEEHFEVLAETIKLDHLYLLFKSLYSERLMELKSLNDDVQSLHAIKNNLGNEISRLNQKMSVLETEKMHFSDYASYLEEELRKHLLSLELDLNIVTCLFEELDLHAESTKNILVERETELFEANQKVHSTQEKNMTLKELLEASELDNAKIKLVKEEMEMKVSALSEVIINKNQEIGCLDEENKKMKRDIDRIHERLEVFLCREEHLVSELEKEASEVLQCEEEITAMVNDIHILTVNAAFQDEKFHELVVENQTSAIVQKEVLVSELYFIKEYMEELQNKLYELEGENRGLKADIDVYLLMSSSLWEDVASLEDQILSISQLKLLSDETKEDLSLMSHQHHNSNQPTEDCTAKKASVGLLLEQLNDKVKALQRMTGHTIRLLEQEITDSNASLDAARKEVEILKATVLSGQGKEAIEYSEAEYEQMTKDIQLDQASSSLLSREVVCDMPNVRSREIDDQAWANTGKYNNDQKCEISSTIESEEKENRDMIVDILDGAKRSSEPQEEWNNMICERLDSDAQKLSDLKTNIEELKKRVNSQTYKPAIYGYDPMKEQLREAEGAMFDLTDANMRLKMMAEDCSSNGMSTNPEDKGISKRRQIAEQAKLGSEKIGRLQLKLQKIQYVLTKVEEEHESRRDKAATRNRVLLRDYLYGREDHHKQKGSRFCGFVRPKTKGDY